jgi:protein YIPF1/2
MSGYNEFDPEPQAEEAKNDASQQNPLPASLTVAAYKGHFEVDSDTVRSRLMKTVWPFNRQKFFENKPDLYGAFWVPTTLIFLLSLSGSLGHFIAEDDEHEYSFPAEILVDITGVVYGFVFIVPAILAYFLLKAESVTYTDLLSLYGYSYFMFCPATLLSIISINFLRWGSFGLASVWAAVLMVKNFYDEMESVQGYKKIVTLIVFFSGYIALTLAANSYLFH